MVLNVGAFVAMLDIDMFFFLVWRRLLVFSKITPSRFTAGNLIDNVCLDVAGWPEFRRREFCCKFSVCSGNISKSIVTK